jgi:hypothetical protein
MEADFKFTLEPGSIFREVFKLSFDSGIEEDMREGLFWFVRNDLKSHQNDTYNCGPIACMKVMDNYMTALNSKSLTIACLELCIGTDRL